MAWLIAAGMALLCAALAWKMHRLKQEVYRFSGRLEESLDALLNGSGFSPRRMEAYEDTLCGRVCEKLYQVSMVWEQKSAEGRKEKEQMESLISDISHQTKTPIANLKVYLEMLKDEIISNDAVSENNAAAPVEPNGEFLKRMELETDKLDFLLQGMLRMSRLEAGIIEIRMVQANLFQTLRTAIAAAVPKAGKKQIQISVDCKDSVTVCHDPKWTAEALFNILDNAVKYTDPDGAVHIRVSVQEVFTKISIRDTGKGIALARQAEIFTRFYREPEVHGEEGIGLGLYLARKIIELQKGYVEVASQVGKGSDFQVYLKNF